MSGLRPSKSNITLRKKRLLHKNDNSLEKKRILKITRGCITALKMPKMTVLVNVNVHRSLQHPQTYISEYWKLKTPIQI